MVAIFESKQVFGKMNKSFNIEHLTEYLNEILNNKAKFNKLVPLPKFNVVKEIEVGCAEDACTPGNDQFEE